MIDDDVKQHYVTSFGEPTRRASFQIGTSAAEVFKWDAASGQLGVALYASIGGSRNASIGRHPSHRTEFFIGLDPAEDGVALPLAMTALHDVTQGSALAHGHTLTFQEPLWSGTEMCSFLVMRPKVEIVPDLVLAGGVHVGFLQLIPLFAHELQLKSSRGADDLIVDFERAGVRFWNPRRAPLRDAR